MEGKHRDNVFNKETEGSTKMEMKYETEDENHYLFEDLPDDCRNGTNECNEFLKMHVKDEVITQDDVLTNSAGTENSNLIRESTPNYHFPEPSRNVNFSDNGDISCVQQNEIMISDTSSKKKNIYICATCGKIFSMRSHVSEHILTVHNKTENYICGFCGTSVSHQNRFYEHLQTHYSDKIDSTSNSEMSLTMEASKPSFMAETLKSSFTAENLKTSKPSDTFNSSLTVKTSLSTLRTKASLDSHSSHQQTHNYLTNKSFVHENVNSEQLIARKNGIHVCFICDKSFNTKYNLSRHLFLHTNMRPFTCKICNKSFALKHILSNHMHIHNIQKKYLCDICKKSFFQKSELHKHILLHKSKKRYRCKICQNTFTEKRSILRHMSLHVTINKCYNTILNRSSGSRKLSEYLIVCSKKNKYDIKTNHTESEACITEDQTNQRIVNENSCKNNSAGNMCVKAFGKGNDILLHIIERKSVDEMNHKEAVDQINDQVIVNRTVDQISEQVIVNQKNQKDTFSCHFCMKTFGTDNELLQHIMNNKDHKSIDQLNLKSIDQLNQSRSVNQMNRKENFSSSMGSNIFDEDVFLQHEIDNKRHESVDEINHKAIIDQENQKSVVNEKNQKETFLCNLCAKTFDKENELLQHIMDNKEHQKIDENNQNEKLIKIGIENQMNQIENFTCNMCMKTFNKENDLLQHIMDSREHETVGQINDNVTVKYMNQRTMVNQNNEKQNYSCNICMKTFDKENDLLQHVMDNTCE